MSHSATPLGSEDAPFVGPLTAVLADVLEPDPDGAVLVVGLHAVVLAVMNRRFGHGAPLRSLKRVLRASGLTVRAPEGADTHVYGVRVKARRSGATGAP
jgi:hypothetical protein